MGCDLKGLGMTSLKNISSSDTRVSTLAKSVLVPVWKYLLKYVKAFENIIPLKLWYKLVYLGSSPFLTVKKKKKQNTCTLETRKGHQGEEKMEGDSTEKLPKFDWFPQRQSRVCTDFVQGAGLEEV